MITGLGAGLVMGRVVIASKNGIKMYPDATKETKVNEQDTRVDRSFIGTFRKTEEWRVPVTVQSIYPG